MEFPESRALAGRLLVVAESPSTNDELVRLAAGPEAAQWPDLSVLVTEHQTAGHGRLGRTWVSRAGASLAASVLVRPDAGEDGVPPERYGWFPLVAGLAMARAIGGMVAGAVGVKWPNDVQIDGLKVCGILAEVLPASGGVVVGTGVNLSLRADELPVPSATSVLLKGAAPEVATADAVLAGYLREFRILYRELSGPGEEPVLRVRNAVAERLETIGREVRIELPSGEFLNGVATGIDSEGRLIVRTNDGTSTVAAGDVTHLRY